MDRKQISTAWPPATGHAPPPWGDHGHLGPGRGGLFPVHDSSSSSLIHGRLVSRAIPRIATSGHLCHDERNRSASGRGFHMGHELLPWNVPVSHFKRQRGSP